MLESKIQHIQDILSKYPAMISWSGGKDSSVVLALTLEAAKRNKLSGHNMYPITVMHADPLVDNPEMTSYVYKEIQNIEKFAFKNDLPIQVKVATPSLNDQWITSVIGGRKLPVFHRSHDCTIDLKVKPQDRLRKEVKKDLGQHGEPVSFLGTRFDESTKRKQSMEKRKETSDAIWLSDKGEYMFSPIADWTDADVWRFLHRISKGEIKSYSDFADLSRIYHDGSSQTEYEDGVSVPKCRTGCYVCTAGRDNSLEAMLEADSRYEYMRGLNKLQQFLVGTQHDLSLRQWIGRSINEQGYLTIAPDTYSPQMLENLLRYSLTLDCLERDRAKQENEDPKFEIISPEALVHIDATWSLQGIHPAFHALKIYKDVCHDGNYSHVPEIKTPAPRSKMPQPRYLYTGTLKEHESMLKYNGLRNALLESLEENSSGCMGTRQLKNGNTILDVETEVSMHVDPEAAYFILDQELDYLLDKYGEYNRRYGFDHYTMMGTVSFSSQQVPKIDNILKKTSLKEHLGILDFQDFESVREKIISYTVDKNEMKQGKGKEFLERQDFVFEKCRHFNNKDHQKIYEILNIEYTEFQDDEEEPLFLPAM